ncbi:MAG: hypothetical protein KatS3mg002_1246 [Candidatus Woesearchaeota archaeon]|nr:MAG: hypothetical protein KatS3mg002_1246 [Candidatus Woesearchaeota archaeon]
MISQVLADFVGQIKANINTEIQMRTRDEGDLDRIKTKYGPEVLQGLVKASVGTGMVENPAYNRGRPYFVSFRPLLHNTQRLSDEELEKYNKYNEQIDDLQYQIEQLEELKQDVFDLKLQLKLSLDKVKQGNFNMVEIYLQELVPRVEKMWVKLGKTPKKRELKLIDINSLKEEMKKAEESRKAFEQNNPQQQSAEKKEEKKILKYEKVVEFNKALNFNNGVSVTSLQELLDVMPNITGPTFKHHVNSERNDIADWIEKNFDDKELADKLRAAKNNEEYVKILEEDKAKNNKPIDEKKSENQKADSNQDNVNNINQNDVNSSNQNKVSTLNNNQNSSNNQEQGQNNQKQESYDSWDSLKGKLSELRDEDKIKHLEDVRKKNPKDLNILFSLALLYHKLKNYDASEKIYKEILSFDPKNYKALYYLGGLMKSQKKFEEAANYFNKYLEIKDDPKIKELLDKMKSMK